MSLAGLDRYMVGWIARAVPRPRRGVFVCASVTAGVQDYYDRNTGGFLRFGQGRSTGGIHRAVWGPGITSRDQAFRFVEDNIAPLLRSDANVLDLGCGVGASLAYLAENHPGMRGLGVTLSPVQAKLAQTRFAERGLGGRLRCAVADYCDTPAEAEGFDLAFAIESFLHGSDPAAFFAEACRVLRPGGAVVVCDDFLGDGVKGAARPQCVADFERGWRVGTLLTVAEVGVQAGAAGFELERNDDWTGWLELDRPRDIAIRAMVTLGRRLPIKHPYWWSLVGGDALQRCLRRGLVNYRFTVWRRPNVTAPRT